MVSALNLGMQIQHFTRIRKENTMPEERIQMEEKTPSDLLRVISFVDAPGHETLMAVMISGVKYNGWCLTVGGR